MHIVFISYWGINQGLTKSTVLPHIDILYQDDRVNSITLVTFEREQFESVTSKQYKHIPIDETSGIKGLNKFSSIRVCYKILKAEQPDLVIARSSLAGIAAYHQNKKSGTPYIVESFEPHVDYMLDSGEWKKNSIKTKLLTKYEGKLKKSAKSLLPVSENYKTKLIEEGVNPNKIMVVPCTVDLEKFAFNLENRKTIRKNLNIKPTDTVGIYVGKFGGLYQKDEAFITFKKIGRQFNSFQLIILSPMRPEEIEEIASRNQFPAERMHILSVDQNEVPAYLSASDFSFATYKSFESNQYLSPIKIGEYWAAGLFVCITKNVGDDSEIIISENIGSIIENEDDISLKLDNFKRENSEKTAIKYRSRKSIQFAYNIVLEEFKK